MKRRYFLKTSSVASIPMLINGLPVSALKNFTFSGSEENENILVLLQLNGGNDGLGTVVPLDQYNILANVRSNILIPQNKLLKIEDSLAFHPSMTELKDLYEQGKMNILQNVGYPDQNRSHFRSTDIWTSGSPSDEFWSTGWLGRFFEEDHPSFPELYPNESFPDPIALVIGSNVSETCQGTLANFSMAISNPESIGSLSGAGFTNMPDNYYGEELQFLRTSFEQANAYGKVLKLAAEKGNNVSALYDGNDSLMQQLKTIALLISGGLRTKVYIANLGGFDTHANQVNIGDPLSGQHAELLTRLSKAVSAFQDDLRLLGLEEKVMTMTFSEFGRRIRSNASYGTDHGSAAPMFFFGSCLNNGVLGSNPQLPENPASQDGVAMEFDFRDVYGTVLIDWLGMEEESARLLLHEDFIKLPVIQACKTTPTEDISGEITLDLTVYPNPALYELSISFLPKSRDTMISIYNSMGSELFRIRRRLDTNRQFTFKYNVSGLTPGNYFCRVQSGRSIATRLFVRV